MKKILALLLVFTLLFAFASCTKPNGDGTESSVDTTTAAVTDNHPAPTPNNTEINVIALKGPTGMGMAYMMENPGDLNCNFSLMSAPTDVQAEIVKGNFDIAAVPTNLAAALYNKLGGGFKIAAVNTLGVLYMLENGNTIQSISDLEGKTIYATGQGSTPEYILKYILEKNNVNATIEFLTDHTELQTKLASDVVTVGMLPQPNVTSVLLNNDKVRIALDMTAEWDAVESDAFLAQGCIIVKDTFAAEHAALLESFMKKYEESVTYVNENVDDAAALMVKHGIVGAEAIAKKAIPACNIVLIRGEEMAQKLAGFFGVLHSFNPKAVGGKLPDNAIYAK